MLLEWSSAAMLRVQHYPDCFDAMCDCESIYCTTIRYCCTLLTLEKWNDAIRVQPTVDGASVRALNSVLSVGVLKVSTSLQRLFEVSRTQATDQLPCVKSEYIFECSSVFVTRLGQRAEHSGWARASKNSALPTLTLLSSGPTASCVFQA